MLAMSSTEQEILDRLAGKSRVSVWVLPGRRCRACLKRGGMHRACEAENATEGDLFAPIEVLLAEPRGLGSAHRTALDFVRAIRHWAQGNGGFVALVRLARYSIRYRAHLAPRRRRRPRRRTKGPKGLIQIVHRPRKRRQCPARPSYSNPGKARRRPQARVQLWVPIWKLDLAVEELTRRASQIAYAR